MALFVHRFSLSAIEYNRVGLVHLLQVADAHYIHYCFLYLVILFL